MSKTYPALNSTFKLLAPACLMLCLIGCADPNGADEDDTPPKKVFNETTQDIGEAKEGDQQADMSIKPSVASPIAAPLQGYGSAVSQISKMQIKQMVELYRAEHGEYPKTHKDFMEKVILANNVQLPELPGNRKYKYDVENHELIVVEADNE